MPRDDFAFCLVVKAGDPTAPDAPDDVRNAFEVVVVGETPTSVGPGGQAEDAVEAALGAREVKRNSADMVEYAFDGELDEVRGLIDKGFYVDSVDSRKHTSLSDAASQGHAEVVEYLLDLGADPNSASDLNRTPLWRAAYNGHHAMCSLLLAAGADPKIATTDFEQPFDVANNDETKTAPRPRENSSAVATPPPRRRRHDAAAAATPPPRRRRHDAAAGTPPNRRQTAAKPPPIRCC